MRKKMFYGANKFIFENAKVLRNNLTHEELVFWTRLKNFFPKYKFRRQHPIANYIADIYCHALKLVIEVDGSIHLIDEIKEKDKDRQNELEKLGFTVIRFTNEEVKNHIEMALKRIEEFIKHKTIC
jgi:imidazole glycerol-phosphate synthase subunit HisF